MFPSPTTYTPAELKVIELVQAKRESDIAKAIAEMKEAEINAAAGDTKTAGNGAST